MFGNIKKLRENIKGIEKNTQKESETLPIKASAINREFEDNEKINLFSFGEKKKVREQVVVTGSQMEETHYIINKITSEIYSRDPDQIKYVSKLAEVRGLNPKTLLDNQCFYITSPEYIESLFSDLPLYKDHIQVTTSSNTLWKKRLVIPIRDFYGEVYGFVGWDKFSPNAKYVEYSAELYRKSTLKVLGLNHIERLLENYNYLILTEGSFDYFRGIENDLSIIANLGVSFNRRLEPLLNRFKVIFIAYDSDDAGKKNTSTIQRLHPNTYRIVLKDIPKVNEEGVAEYKKQDLDDVLKDKNNVKILKREIAKRSNFPNIRMKDIYL